MTHVNSKQMLFRAQANVITLLRHTTGHASQGWGSKILKTKL